MIGKNLIHVVALAAILGLSGCASSVSRPSAAPAEGRAVLTGKQFATVSLLLTQEAKGKLTEGLFNGDELLGHVRRALSARTLLNAAADPRLHLEVQVKDVRIRSNFAAVMWGVMAGSDSIAADIVLRNPAGEEVDRFEVSVSYGLGGFAGGQDTTRMGWLYEQFAAATVSELKKQ